MMMIMMRNGWWGITMAVDLMHYDFRAF